MKWAALLLLLAAPAWAALPDSLTGKVYRDAVQQTLGRATRENTILFRANGRFVHLKRAVGSQLQFTNPGSVFIGTPQPDGNYTYTKTGAATATVDLAYDGGTRESLLLTFTSDTDGFLPNFEGTFSVTDVISPDTAPMLNVSLRGRVTPGRGTIAGFVIPGTRSREVLIRAVGPSLASFGVADLWADPDFQVYRGAAPVTTNEAHRGDWSAEPPVGSGAEAGYRKIFTEAGAFPLVSGSKDAADVLRLAPGAYTVQCNPPAGDPGGEVLIEVYLLP